MAAELTKLPRAETKLLFESLAKGSMGVITGSQCDLGDIYCPHSQFASRAFQAQAAHIAGSALTNVRGEDAMEMRHREPRDFRQHFPIKRLVEVRADIAHYLLDALRGLLKSLGVGQHIQTIVYQNTCSLLQMYHFIVT